MAIPVSTMLNGKIALDGADTAAVGVPTPSEERFSEFLKSFERQVSMPSEISRASANTAVSNQADARDMRSSSSTRDFQRASSYPKRPDIAQLPPDERTSERPASHGIARHEKPPADTKSGIAAPPRRDEDGVHSETKCHAELISVIRPVSTGAEKGKAQLGCIQPDGSHTPSLRNENDPKHNTTLATASSASSPPMAQDENAIGREGQGVRVRDPEADAGVELAMNIVEGANGSGGIDLAHSETLAPRRETEAPAEEKAEEATSRQMPKFDQMEPDETSPVSHDDTITISVTGTGDKIQTAVRQNLGGGHWLSLNIRSNRLQPLNAAVESNDVGVIRQLGSSPLPLIDLPILPSTVMPPLELSMRSVVGAQRSTPGKMSLEEAARDHSPTENGFSPFALLDVQI